MTPTTYRKLKQKYDKELSSGLLFVYYQQFTGDWNADKRKWVKLQRKINHEKVGRISTKNSRHI